MSDTSEHTRVMELLPWYVNDTLAAEDRALVDRHVRRCVPCRLALREEQTLKELVGDHPSVHLSAERGFERLMRVIDTQPAAGRTRLLVARYALAASAFIAVVLAAVLVAVNLREPAGEFETLSAPVATSAIRLDVVFESGIMESELRDLVRSVGASVVDGPSDVGRYTIQLDGSAAVGADVQAIVSTLRDDRRVRFVARSSAPEVP